ncbi:IS256 family transposase [Auritidibacter ignavus]|uniref:IS256 family transposase n=1 Tax=Auritidibacter TaxID=1160973 RepID=UPI000D737572|nr:MULTISPECIES: IS256 family transposase [Auritidibacter]PXA76858.1 IS256 family transposase [Auritidibacter sp. NML100628]PXA80006.1 IS256 family transposase [Auritidibacter sp. NML120779]RMX23145.1 IS256 family transposase [Auritidibacter ignavus]WHS35843.1 IS256 family transposase [Auritidibacter ignavus]
MSEIHERCERLSGADVVAELKASGALDGLFARIDAGEIELTGDGGMIPVLIREALERGLQAEMTSHLGYEAGDRAGKAVTGKPVNARNGSYTKTVASQVGDIDISVPRDRADSFDPVLVPKDSRKLGGLDEMIVSLYAGGMTIRDIQHHLASTIGTELSHETIANITDAVLDAVMEWQNRALEEFYPVIYLDAIRVKVRDNGQVRPKAAHIAVGVDMDGVKHVLGIWVQNTEGASFWAHVCAELANRGVKDVLIVCCDGLTGLPEAIEATWPDSMVQTCVVHLIRAANRFVAYRDRKAVSKALKAIYTAANEDTAQTALDEFAASELGQKYPSAVATWTNAWDRFTPFLAFPPALRRVIYTTNAIESLNYQLRKITKNRSQFPTDEAVVKLFWLAICNIEDKRARERAKERGKPAHQRKAAGRLIEGQQTTNWKQALAQLAVAFPDRMEPYL